jgi:nitroreductase
LQAYEVVVVRDPERKRQLARAAWGQWFIAEAPVVLVFVANPERNRFRYGSVARNSIPFRTRPSLALSLISRQLLWDSEVAGLVHLMTTLLGK